LGGELEKQPALDGVDVAFVVVDWLEPEIELQGGAVAGLPRLVDVRGLRREEQEIQQLRSGDLPHFCGHIASGFSLCPSLLSLGGAQILSKTGTSGRTKTDRRTGFDLRSYSGAITPRPALCGGKSETMGGGLLRGGPVGPFRC